MFDSTKDLIDKVRLGQDSLFSLTDETDCGAPHRDLIADELSALANAQGGVFLIGVNKQTHETVGIPSERVDAVEGLVRDACTQSIDPPLTPNIHRCWLPAMAGGEAAVVKVEIARGLFLHRGPRGYLHRLGSRTLPISSEYIARLLDARSNQFFDMQPVHSARLADLLPELGERFRPARVDDEPAKLLTKLGMARPDHRSVLRPTVAGVLMASEDPRWWLPNAYVQAAAYRGSGTRPDEPTDAYRLDASDISGPLDLQVSAACRFVARNTRTMGSNDREREDQSRFDMAAVFEAILNAVAHRDYSIHDSKIRLRLYENRLELYSPGALPGSMTIDSLPFRQSCRNDAIMSLLAKCPAPLDVPWLEMGRRTLMDKRGEGVPIILDNSTELSGKEPEYRLIDDEELLLTIYASGE